MSLLVLVRHSNPATHPALHAHDWVLSVEGISNASTLASDLSSFLPFHLASSPEPKALQTAQIVAEGLQLRRPHVMPELHEHLRRRVGWFDDESDRRAMIEGLFADPAQVVFGEESGDVAYQRFKGGIERLKAALPTGTSLVAVTHGTVMALFAGYENDLPPMQIWDKLSLPCYIVLDLQTYRMQRIVNRL